MNPTRIRLGGPSDILAVLPYQLGFHPRESLVVVSLHGTRMGLVQRIDLPPPEHDGRSGRGDAAPAAAGRAGRGPAARVRAFRG